MTTAAPIEPASEPAAPTPSPSTPLTWRESLDADLRESPFATKYESLSEAVKAGNHLMTKVGEKGLILPKADAGDEAWGEVWQALGRPDSPAAYELEGFEKPEWWNDEGGMRALSKMHELGLNSRQARALIEWTRDQAKGQMEGASEADGTRHAEWDKELAGKWGTAAEKRYDLAERVARGIGGIEEIANARLPGGGLLKHHPGFRDFLAEVGQQRAEDGLLGDAEPSRFGATPEQAQAKLKAFEADPEKRKILFGEKTDPRYEAVADEYRKLMEQAYPGHVQDVVISE